MARWIRAAGMGVDMRRGSDVLGIATSYGAPVDETAGAQTNGEIFYRLQLADHPRGCRTWTVRPAGVVLKPKASV